MADPAEHDAARKRGDGGERGDAGARDETRERGDGGERGHTGARGGTGARSDVGECGALRVLGARRIVGFVADAAERWRDADFAPRVRATAAIEARLGYTTPVVDYALDRLFAGITREALEAAIASELGSVEALDGLVARRGAPAAWARGVERAVVVSSDTTIGVAVVPALFALCAKCDVVVKDRSDALVAGFFSTLAEEHPAFAGAAVARGWRGGDDPDEDALLARADTVVAFGRDETLRAIRARCGAGARFVPFGHRASIGRLTRADVAAFDDALAERIARDALLYDGEGCLSLHALFVHANGDELARVAATLAAACERVSVEFPGGTRSPQRLAQIASHRNLAAFRAAAGRGAVFRGGDATLVAAPPHEDPPPFLPRVLPLIAVADDDAIAAYVDAQRLPVQALGVRFAAATATPDERSIAPSRDARHDAGRTAADLAHTDGTAADVAHADGSAADVALAVRVGAVRVAPFGAMQDPPLGGHHGGSPRIADFVRWIDSE